VVEIGRAQFGSVRSALDASESIVVSDTFMLELKVWTEVRFHGEPEVISDMRKALKPDIYVLCKPDLPWQPDPLRENPDDRDKLYKLYQQCVYDSGIDFVEAYGSGPGRMERVVESIRLLM
jgi:nicotinamide riboside kinase